MKTSVQKFKNFIRKHIWADALYVFAVYAIFQLIANYLKSDSRSISEILYTSAGFALVLTPIIRLTRATEDEIDLYLMVDHVRHYQLGQVPQLKFFLESKGYSLVENEGTVSYYKSDKESILSTTRTFIHETDHWIALVAPPKILDQVPSAITSIYPQKAL